jgi:hypothetical protein
MTERDEVAEHFAAEPGKGQIAAQALAERETAAAYGHDTSRPDKILAGLGYVPRAVREAAAKRKAAAEEKAEELAAAEKKPARSEPPKGRVPPAGRQQKG